MHILVRERLLLQEINHHLQYHLQKREEFKMRQTELTKNITVVGSRANGTAGPNSDWDYIMSGNSAQRHSAASSIPRGVWGGENNTGIDIFSSYPNGPNPVILDKNKPYIEFFPQ